MTNIKKNESLWTLKRLLDYIKEKDRKFFIPSYQRGYRWKPYEVKQLLDDVNSCESENYFLQLLAVREEYNPAHEHTHLRIIDGQQRLTTALLILDCLNQDSKYVDHNIEYETRNTAEGIDAHFRKNAKKTIEEWLEKKTDEEKFMLNNKIMNCEFLYFKIEEKKDEYDFFSRLNTWKISATDSELVKCFFLSEDDKGEIEQRAIQWNQMERALSNNQFWGMFANHNVVGKDRMEVLLRFVPKVNVKAREDKKELEEKFPLFEACKRSVAGKDEKARNAKKAELWGAVEAVFVLLQKWYVNRHERHLVGWYFQHKGNKDVGEVADSLISDAAKTATALIEDGNWLGDTQLYYNNGGLHNYLFLANVAWCSERFGVDYNFFRHALIEHWSIEHVHARNQRKLDETEFKGLKFNKDSAIDALWNDYVNIDDKDQANEFLKDHLLPECGYPEEDEDNSLGNLALLPSDTNSSLNNKLFVGKQREILSWALQGKESYYWAPPLTIAMFVKEVGAPAEKFSKYWSKNDRNAYVEMLSLIIKKFLGRFPVTQND